MALAPCEKALVQLVLSAAFIEDSVLKTHFGSLKRAYGYNGSLEEAFVIANQELRKVCMEIKTVVLKRVRSDGPPLLVRMHAMANTDDDAVARELKNFTDSEIKLFRGLIDTLLSEKYLSMDDIKAAAKNGVPELENFLGKLLAQGWLQRDDRNYWELGPRVYLELRQHLEAAIAELGDEADEAEKLAALPQIIFY